MWVETLVEVIIIELHVHAGVVDEVLVQLHILLYHLFDLCDHLIVPLFRADEIHAVFEYVVEHWLHYERLKHDLLIFVNFLTNLFYLYFSVWCNGTRPNLQFFYVGARLHVEDIKVQHIVHYFTRVAQQVLIALVEQLELNGRQFRHWVHLRVFDQKTNAFRDQGWLYFELSAHLFQLFPILKGYHDIKVGARVTFRGSLDEFDDHFLLSRQFECCFYQFLYFIRFRRIRLLSVGWAGESGQGEHKSS